MKIFTNKKKIFFLVLVAFLVGLIIFYFKLKSQTAYQYAEIGQKAFMNDNYKQAIRYYKKALVELKKDVDCNKIDMAVCLNKIGMSYLFEDKYTKAFKYIDEALELDRKYKNFCNFTLDYNSLGTFFFLKHQNKEAIYYFKKALDFSCYNKSQNDVCLIYSNIGAAYGAQGDYDTDKIYHSKIIKYHIEKHEINHSHIFEAYTNIGNVLLQEGEYKYALDYYNKAFPFIMRNYKPDSFYYKTINKNIEICRIRLMIQGKNS